jgi:hypothetical protein
MKKINLLFAFVLINYSLIGQNSVYFIESKPTVNKLEYVPSYKSDEIDLRYLEKNQSDYLRQSEEQEKKAQIEYQRMIRMYDKISELRDKVIQFDKFLYTKWNESSERLEVFDKDDNKIGHFQYYKYNEIWSFVKQNY